MKEVNRIILLTDGMLIGNNEIKLLHEILGDIDDIIHFGVRNIEKSRVNEFLIDTEEEKICIEKSFLKEVFENYERSLSKLLKDNDIYIVDFSQKVIEKLEYSINSTLEEVSEVAENELVAIFDLDQTIYLDLEFFKTLNLNKIINFNSNEVKLRHTFDYTDDIYSACMVNLKGINTLFSGNLYDENNEINLEFEDKSYLINIPLYIVDTEKNKLYKVTTRLNINI